MSGDKFRKTQAGRPLEIPAPTWNAMVDAARAHAEGQLNQTGQAELGFRNADIIKVRNQSGQDLDRFSVLGIDQLTLGSSGAAIVGRMFKGRLPIPGTTMGCRLIPSFTLSNPGHFPSTWEMVHPNGSSHLDLWRTASHPVRLKFSGSTAPSL